MSGGQVWEDGSDVWESSMKQGLAASTILMENGQEMDELFMFLYFD